MLKTIVFGSWSGGITALALYLSLSIGAPTGGASATDPQSSLIPHFSQPEFVVAPIISERTPSGFLFSQVVLEFAPESKMNLNVPMGMIIQDSYNAFLIGNEDFSFPRVAAFDIAKFKDGLRETINASIGGEHVTTVYLNQINFIESENVRSKQKLKTIYTDPDDQDKSPKQPSKPKDKGDH